MTSIEDLEAELAGVKTKALTKSVGELPEEREVRRAINQRLAESMRKVGEVMRTVREQAQEASEAISKLNAAYPPDMQTDDRNPGYSFAMNDWSPEEPEVVAPGTERVMGVKTAISHEMLARAVDPNEIKRRSHATNVRQLMSKCKEQGWATLTEVKVSETEDPETRNLILDARVRVVKL